jgi:hypothetical protein
MTHAPNGLRLLVVGALVSVGSAGALIAASACGFNQNATTELVGPDFSQFVGVLPDGGQTIGVCQLLQTRCGTLDCHGQISRPLRIYGQEGLRLTDGGSEDAENMTGQEPTTAAEFRADYLAVIGLQPELMAEVVQGSQPPDALMLVRKPAGLERHKGGQVIVQGPPPDPAYQCIVSWLTTSPEAGGVDYGACASASQL